MRVCDVCSVWKNKVSVHLHLYRIWSRIAAYSPKFIYARCQMNSFNNNESDSWNKNHCKNVHTFAIETIFGVLWASEKYLSLKFGMANKSYKTQLELRCMIFWLNSFRLVFFFCHFFSFWHWMQKDWICSWKKSRRENMEHFIAMKIKKVIYNFCMCVCDFEFVERIQFEKIVSVPIQILVQVQCQRDKL